MQIEGRSFQILELPDNAMKCFLKKEDFFHWQALVEMIIYKDYYLKGHSEDKAGLILILGRLHESKS